MSPPADCWQALSLEIDRARQNPQFNVSALQNSLLRRLKLLGDRGHCAARAIGWLQKIDGRGHRARITFKPAANGRDNRGHPALSLASLSHLRDGAVLALSLELDTRRSTLLSYTVSLQGRRADCDRPYHARVDLTEHQEGQGHCGHPLLHCHLGEDPEEDGRFCPRIPLPWLAPGDALDWLLATVEPSLEPRAA